MAPPRRRSCAFCETATGRMITCRRCLQYFHPPCVEIDDDAENLKEVEQTFVCIVCQTSTEDNSVERELEPCNTAEVNRYTAAVSRKKVSQSVASAEGLRSVRFVGMREAIALSRSTSSLPDTARKPTTAAKRRKTDAKKSHMAAKRSRLSLNTDGASTDSWWPTKVKKPAKKQKKQDKRNDTAVLYITPSDAAEAGEKQCLEHCRNGTSGDMIACDKCDIWFHYACVALSEAEANMIENYYCRQCFEYPEFATTYKDGTPLESRNRSRIPVDNIVSENAEDEAPDERPETRAKTPSTSSVAAMHIGEPPAGNHPPQDANARQEALVGVDDTPRDLEERNASASSDEASQVDDLPAASPSVLDTDANEEPEPDANGKEQDHEDETASRQMTPARSDALETDAARRHDSGCYSQQASPDQADKNAHMDTQDVAIEEQEAAPDAQVKEELHEEDPGADYQELEANAHRGAQQDVAAEVDYEAPEEYDVEHSSSLYYLARPGDCLVNKYYVYRKLGYGTFGTVWLCLDDELQRMVAVKIAKAGRTCTQNAREEVNQLNAACKWSEHPGRTHIIDLLEVFEMPGENEWPHVCTVFPVGESLLTHMRKMQQRNDSKGLPRHEVQRIMREILLGLDYLGAEAKMVHLDLKLENVLLMRKQQVALDKAYAAITARKLKPHYVAACDYEAGRLKISKETKQALMTKLLNAYRQLHEDTRAEFTVCIADLGSAESITNLRRLRGNNTLQTSHYRAPETVLQTVGDGYGPWMDVWSAGCIAFELATGDLLFDPRHDAEGFEDEHDLLTLVYEAFGAFPAHVLHKWSKLGRRYDEFFQDGKLTRYKQEDCKPWPVENVLRDKYDWSKKDARRFGAFLRALLDYDTQSRPSASDSLRLKWLNADQAE